MTKAYGYLRVSGISQLEGDGFARQREAISTYAQAHDIEIVRWFEEKGVSGTKDLDKRPALQNLLLALHSDGIQTVLIEKLDRLARDLMIQETILGDMKHHGFKIISVQEPDLCSDDPSRKLVRQIFGAIAEYERAMIVLKLRAAKQRIKAKGGRCDGRKPFPDPRRPREQETFAKIMEMRSSGMNYQHITNALNAEELPTRYGSLWQVATVRQIVLRNADHLLSFP